MKKFLVNVLIVLSAIIVYSYFKESYPKVTCVPIITNYMTKNDCYNTNSKIEITGIMVHSTSVPGVMAHEWFNFWNKSYKYGEMDREVCVHAFIDDKYIYQYLPWDHRGWHAGGSANDHYIGFEICEPEGITYSYNHGTMVKYDLIKNQEYFDKIWNNSVYLCAYLCTKYNLTEKNIICHDEGAKLGIASNHPDITHWWPLHGKDMNMFRKDVKKQLKYSILK